MNNTIRIVTKVDSQYYLYVMKITPNSEGKLFLPKKCHRPKYYERRTLCHWIDLPLVTEEQFIKLYPS